MAPSRMTKFGAADEFPCQTCQQILIYTGQVGIGLIAMVTGHVHLPSSPPTEAESWCWFVQPVLFSIWISFTPCSVESTRDITPPKQHSPSLFLCLSHFSIISLFYQPRHLSVSHPLGKNKLGVDTGREVGRDEPQSRADAYFPAERFADNGVVCWWFDLFISHFSGMDLIGCGAEKPQELLWAERNHCYVNYFHVFSLVRCINKAAPVPGFLFLFSPAWPCSLIHLWWIRLLFIDLFFCFFQNKQFLGQDVKLASPQAHPVCDHVTQTPSIRQQMSLLKSRMMERDSWVLLEARLTIPETGWHLVLSVFQSLSREWDRVFPFFCLKPINIQPNKQLLQAGLLVDTEAVQIMQ